jgi:hypothetical protein
MGSLIVVETLQRTFRLRTRLHEVEVLCFVPQFLGQSPQARSTQLQGEPGLVAGAQQQVALTSETGRPHAGSAYAYPQTFRDSHLERLCVRHPSVGIRPHLFS